MWVSKTVAYLLDEFTDASSLVFIETPQLQE
jgi:hypothetical protein